MDFMSQSKVKSRLLQNNFSRICEAISPESLPQFASVLHRGDLVRRKSVVLTQRWESVVLTQRWESVVLTQRRKSVVLTQRRKSVVLTQRRKSVY